MIFTIRNTAGKEIARIEGDHLKYYNGNEVLTVIRDKLEIAVFRAGPWHSAYPLREDEDGDNGQDHRP